MTQSSTPLEFALLGLLRMNPQSGYDLRKTFSSTPMRHYSDSPGSIYPALRRMQAKKWIVGADEDNNARKRHVYRVTAAGKKAIQEWLSKPVTREDVIWGLDELMLRFAFLDGNVPLRITLDFLTGMERELDTYIHELRTYLRISGMATTINTGTLAFQFGIDSYEANLAWARRVRKQLGEKK